MCFVQINSKAPKRMVRNKSSRYLNDLPNRYHGSVNIKSTIPLVNSIFFN